MTPRPMTALLPPASPNPQGDAPNAARTLDTLATVLILILTVGILYLAREILVPIAIAVLLSFVLSPLVKLLRGIGIGKTISVSIVVLLTFLIAVGVGAVLTKQISDLAADASKYQATVTQKVDGVRAFASGNPVLGRLNALIADASRMAPANDQKKEPAPPAKPSPSAKPAQPAPSPLAPQSQDQPRDKKAPVPVEIVSPPPGVLTILQAVAGSAASPLATAAFVAIFIVFILLQREDLRNRFIRLVGFGDLQRTTLAMNEAASRLSRYFLAQVLLNLGFGIIVAIALALIGVPSAILWGIVAMFMRFIPYIGSIGAALFPVLMGAAASPGWTMVIETAALFAVSELIVGQVVEPLVYGRNTGLSPIAVVLAATFWTWLWGPIGLVLSTPLTVCLVVMGRHVERFGFLDVILGDAPALTPVQTFYQRMLAGDPSEIVDHADTFLRDHTLMDYCDQVAMHALLMAQIDVRRGLLEETKQSRIRDTIRDLVDDLVESDEVMPDGAMTPDKPLASLVTPIDDEDSVERHAVLPKVEIDDAWRGERSVICVAARTPLDEAAAHILADLLAKEGIGAHVEPAESMTARTFPADTSNVKLVIISALDADLKVSYARFAVRRLRRRIPGVPIIAAFWMPETDEGRAMGLCHDVHADSCVSSLPDAIALCVDRAAARTIADAA